MIIQKLLYKHSSLLVMLISAFCMFNINIVAKSYLEPEQYTQLALYLIYIGYLGALSFLASDNVIIRYAHYKNNRLCFPKNVLIIAAISWLIAFILLPQIALKIFSFTPTHILLYYLPVLFISVSIALSLIARLTENFLLSQLFLHGWKVIFFCLILFFVIHPTQNLNHNVLWMLSVSMLISAFVSLVYFFKSEKFIFQESDDNIDFKSILKMQYSFILSLLYFAVLGSADRVILSSLIPPEVISDYLYFISILLFPIGIIASYVGFKELIFIKNGKNININKTIKKSLLLSVFLYIIYSFVIYQIQNLISLKFDLIVWGGILIIIICKIPYSIHSAVLGAKSTSKDVIQINHISFVILLVTCGVIYFYESYYIAIYSISFAWITRVLLFSYKSRKYV